MLNPLWLKHGIAPNGYKYGRLRDEIIKLDVEYTPKGK
jgi:hypothetical protein